MRTLVVGAAPVASQEAFYERLLAEADSVVAADAAAEWCAALGRVPDVAVGDFDSAAPGAIERLREFGVPVRAVPAHKDVSDLDLALEAARTLGADVVTFTAAFSERLDHTLASLGTLASAADVAGEAAEPTFAAFALDAASRGRLDLTLEPGTTVSVFAVTPARGVTLDGLEYPLVGADLDPLGSLGLSNVAVDEGISVRVEDGALVVIAQISLGARAKIRVGERKVYW